MQLGQISRLKSRNVKDDIQEADLELLPLYDRSVSKSKIMGEVADHINSLKQINKALRRFRLSKNEAKVYLYLARHGAQKAQKIAEALDVHRTEAYKILRNLEAQGLVTRILERPMKFLAAPLENVLDSLIEGRRQRIRQLEQRRDELLSIWRSLPEPEKVSSQKETFQVLEGKRQIAVKVSEVLRGCDHEFGIVISDENLVWLYNSSFFEDLEEICEERDTDARLLTNYSPTSMYVLGEIDPEQCDFAFFDGGDLPGFFVSDSGEIVLLMDNGDDKFNAIWTNYSSIVDSYKTLFKLLWKGNTSGRPKNQMNPKKIPERPVVHTDLS
jgi:sugar-specific transcriptional regulator TrmB